MEFFKSHIIPCFGSRYSFDAVKQHKSVIKALTDCSSCFGFVSRKNTFCSAESVDTLDFYKNFSFLDANIWEMPSLFAIKFVSYDRKISINIGDYGFDIYSRITKFFDSQIFISLVPKKRFIVSHGFDEHSVFSGSLRADWTFATIQNVVWSNFPFGFAIETFVKNFGHRTRVQINQSYSGARNLFFILFCRGTLVNTHESSRAGRAYAFHGNNGIRLHSPCMITMNGAVQNRKMSTLIFLDRINSSPQ